MRFNSYQARMALGITRAATTDNRTISMADFGAKGRSRRGAPAPRCPSGFVLLANGQCAPQSTSAYSTRPPSGAMAGFAGPAISEVTGQPCSAAAYEKNWEGYCNCLFKPGGELMKTCCGPENVRPDGSCGIPRWEGMKFTGFITAPWTWLGRVDRFARRTGLTEEARKALETQYNNFVEGLNAPPSTDGGGGEGGDTGGGGGPPVTGGGSSAQTAAPVNTALLVGGAVLVAVLLLKR